MLNFDSHKSAANSPTWSTLPPPFAVVHLKLKPRLDLSFRTNPAPNWKGRREIDVNITIQSIHLNGDISIGREVSRLARTTSRILSRHTEPKGSGAPDVRLSVPDV